ncbi:hypothetical protein ACNOYE_27050 [Nannocystaceae bacterium ST9]
MFEAAIALMIVLALLASAALPPAWLLWVGVGLGTLGAGFGVPAGLVYHARLWRALRRHDKSTAGFWLNPMRLHDELPERELVGVRLWFAIGAIGFVATLLGALAVVVAVVRLLG